ncbi:hypothetical protein PF011_g28267, partial [Phytophthora fragariae]
MPLTGTNGAPNCSTVRPPEGQEASTAVAAGREFCEERKTEEKRGNACCNDCFPSISKEDKGMRAACARRVEGNAAHQENEDAGDESMFTHPVIQCIVISAYTYELS